MINDRGATIPVLQMGQACWGTHVDFSDYGRFELPLKFELPPLPWGMALAWTVTLEEPGLIGQVGS